MERKNLAAWVRNGLVTAFAACFAPLQGESGNRRKKNGLQTCFAGLAMVILAISGSVRAADDKPVKTYTAADFFNTISFGSTSSAVRAWSPDGSKVLIASDETGVFNVYSVDVKSGERTQLTFSTTSANRPLGYFATDERILFVADGGGNELDHIWVMGEDGVMEDLAPGENTRAMFAGWLPGGDQFVVLTNERDGGAMDFYKYDTASFERQPVYINEAGFSASGISRDGRWIALGKIHSNNDSDIYLYDSEKGGEPVLITEHEGPISHSVYDFTPDGKHLIYATDEHGEFNTAWS